MKDIYRDSKPEEIADILDKYRLNSIEDGKFNLDRFILYVGMVKRVKREHPTFPLESHYQSIQQMIEDYGVYFGRQE